MKDVSFVQVRHPSVVWFWMTVRHQKREGLTHRTARDIGG